MSNLMSLIRRAPKRFSALAAIVAVAIIVPAVASAWGPDRPTFSGATPATYPVFNSMLDNPQVGDERNFVRIREAGTGNYINQVNFVPGKVYDVSVYFHNNAASNLNASGKGQAKDATLKMEVPNVVTGGVNAALTGTISASNTNPLKVWDEAYGKNTSNSDIALRYVSGSAAFTSNGAINGQKLPDSLFTTGAKLGYSSQNGEVPGCNEFSGFVTFKLRVDQPNFEVKKVVSTDEGKTWTDNAKVTPGSTIHYGISYQNTGTNQQDNVSVRDILPNGVSYVTDSTYLMNSTTAGEYKKASDGITTVGYNAGSYQPKGNVFFKFSAKVPSKDALKCGTNTFVNTARVTTNAGYKEDTATVTIDKECEPVVKDIQVCELATKEIVTIKETAFDATKHSKNLDDCKEVVKNITVCELATKKIITIKESDFDASKHSKNVADCKEEEVKKIKVCELSSKQIVVINEKDFDSSKHSKNLADCKEEEVKKIDVCEIATKTIVNINEKDFDATKHTKDLNKCAEIPVTPPELPQTGAGENIVAIFGLGALIASSAYYVASRRALNQ